MSQGECQILLNLKLPRFLESYPSVLLVSMCSAHSSARAPPPQRQFPSQGPPRAPRRPPPPRARVCGVTLHRGSRRAAPPGVARDPPGASARAAGSEAPSETAIHSFRGEATKRFQASLLIFGISLKFSTLSTTSLAIFFF